MGNRTLKLCFRAVLFRMVPKPAMPKCLVEHSFRAVLFRMVPKPDDRVERRMKGFRAVLFRMVPKPFFSLV